MARDLLYLEKHIENHHGRPSNQLNSSITSEICRDLTCRHCDFEGNSAAELNNHMNVHHKVDDRFYCCKCEFETNEQSLLNEHKQTFHMDVRIGVQPIISKPLSCDQCEFKYRLNIGIRKHVQKKHAVDQCVAD